MKTISFEPRRARQSEGEASSTAAATERGAADIPSSIAEPLAQIWRAVLRVDSAVVEDNFFELGGTSLRAMLLASHVERLSTTLDPVGFFETPTFDGLCATVTLAQP